MNTQHLIHEYDVWLKTCSANTMIDPGTHHVVIQTQITRCDHAKEAPGTYAHIKGPIMFLESQRKEMCIHPLGWVADLDATCNHQVLRGSGLGFAVLRDSAGDKNSSSVVVDF